MSHFNPNQNATNPSSSSSGFQTSRSTSRNLELAAYARPNQEESLYELLTVPFYPDPCLYPPPMSMADRSHNYSSFLPVAPPLSHPLTTSIVPRNCFEEFIIPPVLSSRAENLKWGGAVDFSPLRLPNKENKSALGTPLRDCLAGFGLYNPEERLFRTLAAAGKTHIDFKITWPAYPQLDWIVPLSIYGSDSLLVTKRELAHRIAVQYENFILMCENNQLVCQDPRWRIGGGRYTLDRFRLSILHFVEKEIWQVYIVVLTDRDADPKGLKPMRDLSRG